MAMSTETLRIIIGIIGGLIIVTRLYGLIKPDKIKIFGRKMAGLRNGWVRTIYIIIGIFGLWVLYSALVIIFTLVPIFMVVGLLIGVLLTLAGTFALHPEWFPQMVRGVLVDRGDLFVRCLCVIGVLIGVFVLLTAIFGNSWGGR